jgi:hypothetical protein
MNKAHILGRHSTITGALCTLLLGAALLIPAAAAASEPWYIGPKGGDVRKGALQAMSLSSHSVALTQCPPRLGGPKGCACSGSAFPTTGVPAKWQAYVGPKGGITRKGLY